MRREFQLRCTGCGESFLLVDADVNELVDDVDRLLAIALDFGCPICGADFKVARADGVTTHRGPT